MVKISNSLELRDKRENTKKAIKVLSKIVKKWQKVMLYYHIGMIRSPLVRL